MTGNRVLKHVLSYGIHILGGLGISEIVLTGLRGVELLLFGADIISVTIFVVVETLSLIRSMIAELGN